MTSTILIVEADPQIRRFLRATLAVEGYLFHEALIAYHGIVQAGARRPDLILQCVRESSQTPIVVLSARGHEKYKISALDLGADDYYVEKPFAVGELLARIRDALRRAAAVMQNGTVFRFGGVRIDLDKRFVKVDGEEAHLTPNEYKLLQVLIRYPGKVLTQQQLLNEVWGTNHLDQRST